MHRILINTLLLLISWNSDLLSQKGGYSLIGKSKKNFVYDYQNMHRKSNIISLGDYMPDFTINNLINYPSPKCKISDFKGKLLIIDFWATWCKPCISAFRKLDTIQTKYKNDLQILPITYEDSATVRRFMEKMKISLNITFPSGTNDTLLRNNFKYSSIPHYIWVNQEGKVIAITGSEEVTSENIKKAIQQENILIQEKKDRIKNIDFSKQVFPFYNPIINEEKLVPENINLNSIVNSSIFTYYIDGMLSRAHIDSNRFSATNLTIQNLYKWALGYNRIEGNNSFSQFLSDSRTIFETKNPVVLGMTHDSANKLKSKEERQEWLKKSVFCYEMVYPGARDVQKIVLSDLNKQFDVLLGIKGALEKRKVKCLALVRTSQTDKLASQSSTIQRRDNAYYFMMKKSSIAWFIDRLAAFYMSKSTLPIIDFTNYKGLVDIEINARLADLNSVNKELQKYDLELKEVNCEIDMIVIKDTNK